MPTNLEEKSRRVTRIVTIIGGLALVVILIVYGKNLFNAPGSMTGETQLRLILVVVLVIAYLVFLFWRIQRSKPRDPLGRDDRRDSTDRRDNRG